MKIFIMNPDNSVTVFDPNETPICILLTPEDKKNISPMISSRVNNRYYVCPDGTLTTAELAIEKEIKKLKATRLEV